MTPAAKQPPTSDEAKLLRGEKLKRVKDSDSYACLRWRSKDGNREVFYGSERACPWGVRFYAGDRWHATLWTFHLPTALAVLSAIVKR